jgi:Fe-S cluster assembly iron-binding protein IscA
MALVSAEGAVQVVGSPASPASPANVERYGDEIRETFLGRSDKLTFRVDDGAVEHRFFENGRVDHVKQLIENRKEGTREVIYSLRPDGCTRFLTRVVADSQTQAFTAEFDGRRDGVKSFHVVLRGGASLNVGTDSAVSVIREKMLHAAVKLDPNTAAGHFLELYQNQEAKELRVITQENDFTAKKVTVTFNNAVPTDDARYEPAKVHVMAALRTLVGLERELHLNMYPFAEGQTNDDMVVAHRERLYALSAALFSAFDEVSTAAL